MTTIKLGKDGRFTLPKSLRKKYGNKFDIREESGAIALSPSKAKNL